MSHYEDAVEAVKETSGDLGCGGEQDCGICKSYLDQAKAADVAGLTDWEYEEAE